MGKVTMYRLMLYYLIFLVCSSVVLSFFRLIPYNYLDILLEALYLSTICYFGNFILGKIFKVPTNPESSAISGFILSLIMGPYSLVNGLLPLTFAAFLAMASKYLLAINKKHIFNPAAFGALAAGLILGKGASWWIGTPWMLLPTIFGGLLILNKIRRFRLVGTFLFFFTAFLVITHQLSLTALVSSPIIFFSCVMLIEPLTSPFNSTYQIIYALIVASLFNLSDRLPISVPFPLELSLLTGNIFSYMVSKNFRQTLRLKEKKKESYDVYSFIFEPLKKINFKSGQYLEWMLPHQNPDSRGVRRYFTISSSPSEDFIMLSTKFYEKPSTFKQKLLSMQPGDEILALDLEGEFTLPSDKSKKLCFIAGGIGITPFRSMAKYMIDTNDKRDIVLLFSNKTKEDIVFKDIFDKALQLGWKTIYVNVDTDGLITEKNIPEKVPDWKERQFFVSGPQPMVEAFEKMLYGMGLSKREVKRDYFPGYD